MMSGMAWDIIGMMAVGVGIAAALYAASHALRKAGAQEGDTVRIIDMEFDFVE